jgi:hypothetical protein
MVFAGRFRQEGRQTAISIPLKNGWNPRPPKPAGGLAIADDPWGGGRTPPSAPAAMGGQGLRRDAGHDKHEPLYHICLPGGHQKSRSPANGRIKEGPKRRYFQQVPA